MTRLSTHEQIVVMQAFVDGKEVEVEMQGSGKVWILADRPRWDWYTFNYRIKVEPKEMWAVYSEEGVYCGDLQTKEEAESYVNSYAHRQGYTIHKMVEDMS